MDEKDRIILLKIKDQCDKVENKLKSVNNDFETFQKDIMAYDSISMNIFQIGEASIHLSEEYIEKTSKQIPWFEIKGMRNRFGHDYFNMEPKIIFETALNDIKILSKFIEKELNI